MSARVTKLDLSFYARPAEDLAPSLIGKVIVRTIGHSVFRARIVETEAYVGSHDLASHASKGRTKRTQVMFGPAGKAYVYLIYGMHSMLNIVAAGIDDPQAVLLRAAEPLDGWKADLSGPGKLARGLFITRADNGIDLTNGALYLNDNPTDRPRVVATTRVGIGYAREWSHKLLRFVDPASQALSDRTGVPAES